MENELTPPTIGEKIAQAESDGDIAFLKKMVDTKQLDPLAITQNDKWNYLHRANIWTPSPPETIRFYLEQGVPVNAQDRKGYTPLHFAMRAQNADAALVLLEAGADPNIPNMDNIVPMAMMGNMPDRLDVLEMMLKKGGNIHYHSGNTGLSILDTLKAYRADDKRFQPIIAIMERYNTITN